MKALDVGTRTDADGYQAIFIDGGVVGRGKHNDKFGVWRVQLLCTPRDVEGYGPTVAGAIEDALAGEWRDCQARLYCLRQVAAQIGAKIDKTPGGAL